MVSTKITTATEAKLDELMTSRGLITRDSGFGQTVLKFFGPANAARNGEVKFLASTYLSEPRLHQEAIKLDQFLASLPPAQRKQLADRGMALAGGTSQSEDYKMEADWYPTRSGRREHYTKLTPQDIPSKLMVLQKHGGDISIAINAGLAQGSPEQRVSTLMRNLSVTALSSLPQATAQKVMHEIEKLKYADLKLSPDSRNATPHYISAQEAVLQLMQAGAVFKPQQPNNTPLFKKISAGNAAYIPTPLEAAALIDREPGLPLVKKLLSMGETAGRENVPAIRALLYTRGDESNVVALGKDLQTLKELGFDLNARGRMNRTAIILATQKDEPDRYARSYGSQSDILIGEVRAKSAIFTVLFNAGANPALQDTTGKSAHSNIRALTETANAAIRHEGAAAAREKADEARALQQEISARLLPMPPALGAARAR